MLPCPPSDAIVQQDGELPHYSLEERKLLGEKLSDYWIGKKARPVGRLAA